MGTSMQSMAFPLAMLVIIGGFLWFMSRNQRRATQATIDLHESLQPGDRVHTTSGLEATIVGLTEDTVDLEIAPGVVTTWMKLAMRDRILPDEPEFEDAEELDKATDNLTDNATDEATDEAEDAAAETRASRES
jgi:preprotein translocase subunit YajC